MKIRMSKRTTQTLSLAVSMALIGAMLAAGRLTADPIDRLAKDEETTSTRHLWSVERGGGGTTAGASVDEDAVAGDAAAWGHVALAVGAPFNDDCANALPLTVPTVLFGQSINGATIDELGACGAPIEGIGIWYSVTGTGTTMTVSTCGPDTNFDTRVSVFCGDCANLTCVAGNDDAPAGQCGTAPNASRVDWCAEAGVEYFILVHAAPGVEFGAFDIVVGDDFQPCDATTICGEAPLGGCCLTDGMCVILSEADCLGQAGSYKGDGTNCDIPVPDDVVMTVEIQTDDFGEETTWEIVDQNSGNAVATGGPYTGSQFSTTDVDVYSGGCYTFTIFDQFGDGMCCEFGSGSYNVFFDSALAASGGAFGSSESTTDIGGCLAQPSPGACCFDDGSCVVTTPDCCEFAGGTYQGDGTLCEDASCGDPGPAVGACCMDGVCLAATADACAALGGTYEGDLVDCGSVVCEVPPANGACCLLGVCSELTEATCGAIGGDYLGDDTLCGEVVCTVPPTTGACCVFGECVETAEEACTIAGGEYFGDGSLCVSVTCVPDPPTGACCIVGTCSEITEELCGLSGGAYQGDDTVCGNISCSGPEPPSGACCMAGECFEVTEENCGLAGGDYEGDGTACAKVSCTTPGPVFGACCVFGECVETASAACAIAGGEYFGDGSVCGDVSCVTEPLTGACCIEGACIDLAEEACAVAGGAYEGDGVECTAVECEPPGPPTGRCCVGECCFEMVEESCLLGGGQYYGDGTSCEALSCIDDPDPVLGGCCLDAGGCVETAEEGCLLAGGTYLGDGTTCEGACGPPLGACCLEDGSCVVTCNPNCNSLGGIYQGDDTDCEGACTVQARLDIRPGNCPNLMNRRSSGVIKMALIGGPDLDVWDVDLSTVRLVRFDRTGSPVAPNDGPTGPAAEIRDLSAGHGWEPCDCTERGKDAIDDLRLTFWKQDLVESLELDAFARGSDVEVTLIGNLFDGTSFVASDCIRLQE